MAKKKARRNKDGTFATPKRRKRTATIAGTARKLSGSFLVIRNIALQGGRAVLAAFGSIF